MWELENYKTERATALYLKVRPFWSYFLSPFPVDFTNHQVDSLNAPRNLELSMHSSLAKQFKLPLRCSVVVRVVEKKTACNFSSSDKFDDVSRSKYCLFSCDRC